MPGEHEVHPYLRWETLCRGESCIRPSLSGFGNTLFTEGIGSEDTCGSTKQVTFP